MRRKRSRPSCCARHQKCPKKPFLTILVGGQAMIFCKEHLYLAVLFLTDVERAIGDPAWSKTKPF